MTKQEKVFVACASPSEQEEKGYNGLFLIDMENIESDSDESIVFAVNTGNISADHHLMLLCIEMLTDTYKGEYEVGLAYTRMLKEIIEQEDCFEIVQHVEDDAN